MNKFTIKDIILYANPCFSCNNSIYLDLYVFDSLTRLDNRFSISIKKEIVSIYLKINYYNKLNLKINIKNNSFSTENIDDFIKYLQYRNLYFECICSNCGSYLTTQKAIFNIDKLYLEPLELSNESMFIQDKKFNYSIFLNFKNKNADVVITDIYNPLFTENKIIQFNFPILNVRKLKTKEKLIEKINKIKILL